MVTRGVFQIVFAGGRLLALAGPRVARHFSDWLFEKEMLLVALVSVGSSSS